MPDGPGRSTENFAIYGFQLKIPLTWRVELNPKGNRDKGDVVFHTPKRNRIYVSWGPLQQASTRFRTLEEHRDFAMSELKKTRGMKSVSATESGETRVCGHRALMTRFSASPAGGILSPHPPERELDSAHFYCDEGARYYVVYSLLNYPAEDPDFPGTFSALVHSILCHPSVGSC